MAMTEQEAGPDDLQRFLPISTILRFCEVLKATTCQLIWSHIRKAAGSRKLDRTPLALALLQNHIKCYYTEVGTELCLLCTGRGTRKLLSPWFWPLQRIQKPSYLPHSSSLQFGFMYVSVPLKPSPHHCHLASHTALVRSHFSISFRLLVGYWKILIYRGSLPMLVTVTFTSCLSPSLSAKAGWIILLHMEVSQQKKNHLVVCSFTNLNKAPPRLK